MLPEMGIHPLLLSVLRDREIETQQGQVQMNCEMCKFRIVATTAEQRSGHGHNHDHSDHGHDHAQGHDHAHEHASHEHASHGHTHGHDHGANADPYAEPEKYHNRIWQVP